MIYGSSSELSFLLFNPATAPVFLPFYIDIAPSHQLDRKNCLTLAFNIRCSCLKALSYLFLSEPRVRNS